MNGTAVKEKLVTVENWPSEVDMRHSHPVMDTCPIECSFSDITRTSIIGRLIVTLSHFVPLRSTCGVRCRSSNSDRGREISVFSDRPKSIRCERSVQLQTLKYRNLRFREMRSNRSQLVRCGRDYFDQAIEGLHICQYLSLNPFCYARLDPCTVERSQCHPEV